MLTGIRNTAVLLLGLVLVAVALSACGDGPSEADIEATVVARIEEKQADDAALEAKAQAMAKGYWLRLLLRQSLKPPRCHLAVHPHHLQPQLKLSRSRQYRLPQPKPPRPRRSLLVPLPLWPPTCSSATASHLATQVVWAYPT